MGITHLIYQRPAAPCEYHMVSDPAYHHACAALVKTNPMSDTHVLLCRNICAAFLRRLRKFGTKRDVENFHYHMTWVNYPLRRRPNGKWS